MAVRMVERNISREDVKKAILGGTIIEEYPDDYPLPSCLILGFSNSTPLHVVLAVEENAIIIISVYIPDSIKFESDFQTRRK